MKKCFVAFAILGSALLPLSPALAQSGPPGGGYGPPPEVRARFERIRADAKTSAYNALTPDHRARVQGIVDRVTGTQLGAREAAEQIDAVLTPDEKSAVVDVSRKARESFRSAMQTNGAPVGPPGGGPPSGAPPGGGPPGMTAGRREGGERDGERRQPDAGRLLLLFSLTPEQMRAARPRPSAAP